MRKLAYLMWPNFNTCCYKFDSTGPSKSNSIPFCHLRLCQRQEWRTHPGGPCCVWSWLPAPNLANYTCKMCFDGEFGLVQEHHTLCQIFWPTRKHQLQCCYGFTDSDINWYLDWDWPSVIHQLQVMLTRNALFTLFAPFLLARLTDLPKSNMEGSTRFPSFWDLYGSMSFYPIMGTKKEQIYPALVVVPAMVEGSQSVDHNPNPYYLEGLRQPQIPSCFDSTTVFSTKGTYLTCLLRHTMDQQELY